MSQVTLQFQSAVLDRNSQCTLQKELHGKRLLISLSIRVDSLPPTLSGRVELFQEEKRLIGHDIKEISHKVGGWLWIGSFTRFSSRKFHEINLKWDKTLLEELYDFPLVEASWANNAITLSSNHMDITTTTVK